MQKVTKSKAYRSYYFRSQIRQTLKKKAFEDAGIPVKQVSVQQTQAQPMQQSSQPLQSQQQQQQQQTQQPLLQQIKQQPHESPQQGNQEIHDQSGLMNKSPDMMMTLNRLNAQESEIDVEELATNVKMEFEAGPEEVTG